MDVLSESLTEEQRAVTDAPATDRLLVIAGPGTGKTHTLVHRAVELARRDDTGRPVLALSFTNAVVDEIRERAREAGGARVVASTIDSYAAGIIRDQGETVGPGSYDRTVRRAAELVASDAVPLDVGHILVDEVQDLVGPRADFVLALLRTGDSGFTTFGDPEQAIYTHETDGREDDIFGRIASIGTVGSAVLSVDHRSTTDEPRSPRPSSGGDVYSHLRSLRRLTSLSQLATLLRHAHGGTAVLTRTNGEALWIASRLQALGADRVVVRQSASSRPAPPWVAQAINRDPRSRWTKARFESAVADVPGASEPTAAWREVRRLTRATGQTVAISDIRRGVQESRAAFSTIEDHTAPVVSTIHRAKGLEWDEVTILEPWEDPSTAEEERVLYVATTRSRSTTRMLMRPKIDGKLGQMRGDRWRLSGWRGGLRAVECMFGDVDPLPFGGAAVQELLAEGVKANDPVDLVRRDDGFVIVHELGDIGALSGEFDELLATAGSGSPITKLTGARVLHVRTAAGSPGLSDDAGLPPTGLWLVPEIYGFADIIRGER